MPRVLSLFAYFFRSLNSLSHSPPFPNSSMASINPNRRNSLYPEVIQSNPDAPVSNSNPNHSPSPSSLSNLYPSIDTNDLTENLIPYDYTPRQPSAPPLPCDYSSNQSSAPAVASEEVLIKIPGAILNLIDKEYSVELASGDFTIIRLCQGDDVVAVLARVADDIQWSLAKDTAAVKVDDSHYFFSFRFPKEIHEDSDSSDEEEVRKADDTGNMLSYGLTIASKGQEGLLKELDAVLKNFSSFSEQKLSENAKKKGEALDGSVAKEISPADLRSETKKELMEERSAAYWTTLAPNVEEYSGTAARLIAQGSGQLIRGILWCGDVTVERLKWGNEIMKKRMNSSSKAEISPETLKRIKRVKKVTKMTEKVATGVLCGVVKVSGFFASSFAKTKAGKKIARLLPGEVLLASLDGFVKVCDAVEVSGKQVMSTSSAVTTELVNQRYGGEAAKATSEGLEAAGHAVGTAWAALKIRQALTPKGFLKEATVSKSAAKAAAAELKVKNKKPK